MSEEHDQAETPASQMGLEDLSQIFAPSWARQTPDEVAQKATRFARDEDDEGEDRRGHDRGPRRQNRGEGRPPRRDGDSRPPRRDGDARPPRRDNAPGSRPPRRDYQERRPAPPPPLAIDVRFMPASKALASIIRRIQISHRAYPVRDIVKLFQGDDSSLAVRIETRKDGSEPQQLFQCRVCGMPALSEAEVAEHLLKAHMTDYFTIEEVEGEPVSGNFPCVAKCGLTGELLGPPNHHSFVHRVQEMLHDRFPNMSEEEYRRKIEIIRDPEVVEQWREQSKKKTVYRRKPEPAPEKAEAPAPDAASTEPQASEGEAPAPVESPALERHEAELIFRRDIMPGQIGAASHIVCPATSLQHLPNRRLAAELSARFADETNPNRRFINHQAQQQADDAAQTQRAPRNGSLFTAVHAAFHHRGLYFFRAGDDRGQEFVMASQPVVFDLTHATPELREIAQYVADHPSCPPNQLAEALNPENNEEKLKSIVSQVKWLVEKGHLIQFFNGFLSPPAQHPVFKPNPPKPKKEQPAKKNEAAVAETAEAQAAEAPAAEAAPVEAPAEAPAAEAAPVAETPAEAPAAESTPSV